MLRSFQVKNALLINLTKKWVNVACILYFSLFSQLCLKYWRIGRASTVYYQRLFLSKS